MAILEVKNIEKHFGSTKVLNDISFNLEEGQTDRKSTRLNSSHMA